jgi:hypothetical protein
VVRRIPRIRALRARTRYRRGNKKFFLHEASLLVSLDVACFCFAVSRRTGLISANRVADIRIPVCLVRVCSHVGVVVGVYATKRDRVDHDTAVAVNTSNLIASLQIGNAIIKAMVDA